MKDICKRLEIDTKMYKGKDVFKCHIIGKG